MTKITAYKCPDTGKLFEHIKDYRSHRKKVLAKLAREREIKNAAELDQKWWEKNFWHGVKSLAQLKAAIMLHRDVLALRGLKFDRSLPHVKPTPIVEITEFSLTYNDHISNTHSCPHNGVNNLGRYNTRPLGYSGWHGRIDYRVQSCAKQSYCYPGGGDMWKGTRIHTGTGGGGGFKEPTQTQSFGYDITLWAADWPVMHEEFIKMFTKLILQNENGFCPDSWLVNDELNKEYPAEEYLQQMAVDAAAS